VSAENLVAAIEQAHWERFVGPEYYDPERARQSLRRLALVDDKSAAEAAYNDVLFGIGNNHAGSYYPAALCAVPLLVQISASGHRWPRDGALEILTDLMTSFQAEPGYEKFEGEPVNLAKSLHEAMKQAQLVTKDLEASEPDELLAELRAATDLG
jgi:hypothetical protein